MRNRHVTRTGEKKFLENFRDKMPSKTVMWGPSKLRGQELLLYGSATNE